MQWRPVGTSSSTSARAEECSGDQWGPPAAPVPEQRSAVEASGDLQQHHHQEQPAGAGAPAGAGVGAAGAVPVKQQ